MSDNKDEEFTERMQELSLMLDNMGMQISELRQSLNRSNDIIKELTNLHYGILE